MKITLVETCGACPEQYDAMVGDRMVGYLRLRYGNFTVTCPGVREELVYQKYIGSGMTGCFENKKQRRKQLKKAKKAIKKYLGGEQSEPESSRVTEV